ncbi:MAG: dockerin type I domain-containing protein [Candidatus Eiseniibacteriota bacterium]
MLRFAIALALGLLVVSGPAHTATSTGGTAASPCDFDHRIGYGIRLEPASPCDGEPVKLVVTACAECDHIVAGWLDGAIHLRFHSHQYCPRIPCQAESLVVPLGTFAAGTHRILIEASAQVLVAGTDSLFCEVSQLDTLAFQVGTCPPPPGPPPGPPPRQPFVTRIQVGGTACDGCTPQACPGDSILTLIEGVFPDGCWVFRGVEVFPPDPSPTLPQPPKLRVNVSRNNCVDRVCPLVTVPFAARLNLPPLPPGFYTLEVEERQTVLCSTPPDTSFHHTAAFWVSERCSTTTPTGCFITGWVHGPNPCDAFVSPQQPGQVTLTALTNTVPMAGLQGRLSFYPAGLRITGLAGVGPASTWQVVWEPTANGAQFVMFSTDGSFIPETDPVFPPEPVLRVTVAIDEAQSPPTVTHLSASELRASDPRGLDIPPCPILTPVVEEARICTRGASCDVNLDGAVDVRDLVVMVRCLEGTGPCPGGTTPDCNGDGQSTLDDVLCCAQVVIHGTMPGSAPTRPEPAVQVSFGAPVPTAVGVDVPLRIDAVDRLGAVRLALRFPADRFEVEGVQLPTGTSGWLGLHDVDGSELLVGLIRLDSRELALQSPTLQLALRLRLKGDQTAGGEVRLESGDFSGPDGAALEVDFTPTTLPIGSQARLLLSAPQPSPFAIETRFVVSLPQPEEVELAVHDLAGRRIAVLWRERLDAGTRVFRWRGIDDAGARVRDGVYFIHARIAGGKVTRKVVVLRGGD